MIRSASQSGAFSLPDIVSAILDEIVEALRRGDRVELRGFGAFSAKLRGARQGRNPVLVLLSRSQRKPLPSSKRERRCASGLIAKRAVSLTHHGPPANSVAPLPGKPLCQMPTFAYARMSNLVIRNKRTCSEVARGRVATL